MTKKGERRRAAMLEAMGQDYVRVSRAKGLRESYTILRHVLPNALIPVVTLGGLAYAIIATIGGLGMLALAFQVHRLREGEPAMRVAQQLFGFSILYLFLLFATLLAEHGLGFFRPVMG